MVPRFSRDMSVLGGQRFFLLLVQTVTSVLVSRTLGPDSYGALAFAMSIVGLCALPAMSGMAPLMVREAAQCKQTHDWYSLSSMLSKANIWTAVISILAISAIIFWSFYYIDVENRKISLILSVLFIPLISYTVIYSSVLQGFGQAIYSQSLEWVLTPFIYLSIILILWVNQYLTIETAIIGSLLSIFISFILMIRKNVKILSNLSKGHFNLIELFKSKPDRKWLVVFLPFLFLKLAGSLNNYIPSLMLGLMTSDYSLGIYKVSESISLMASLPLLLINMLIGPRFVALYAVKDLAGIEDLGKKSARITFLLSGLFIIILVIFGHSILELLYGTSYIGSYNALIILSLGQLVNVGCGSVALILNMTGFERDSMKTLMLSTLLNIVLCLVLVPLWQEIGAAMASAISLMLWNMGLVRLVRKRLAIRIAIV